MNTDFERVRADFSCVEIISRYVLVTKHHGKFWGLCPFHEDTKATNFNVYRGKDGIERYNCFACNEHGDVIDFVATIENCTKPEAVNKIVGAALPDIGQYVPKPLPADTTPAWVPIIPVPDDAPAYKPELTYNPLRGGLKNWKSIMERKDPYHNSEGKLLFWVIKLRFDDGAKACIQITFCTGPGGKERKWCARRMEKPYPLMGLDDLALHPNRIVVVVEGEKCKVEHDINAPKLIAVTWLGGASAVKNTDWSPLFGRRLVLMEDDDEPGRKAMKEIRHIIETHGTG